jgi:tetratricopeptide (TPR) repeat protein
MSRKKKGKAPRHKGKLKTRKQKRRASADVLLFGTRAIPFLLLGLTALAMGPVLTNGFATLDDEHFILTNPVVQQHQFIEVFSRQLWSPHYKPLVYISWAFEHLLFGNNAFVFHFTNWLLHLINTWLVFICFTRISAYWKTLKPLAVPVAFFTALVFGVHPLHVESVAWAIERKDVLFTCFYLMATLQYLRFRETTNSKHIYYSAAFYIGSLLSKSMGITFIIIPFLIDYAAGRLDWRKGGIQKWPYGVCFILALVVYGFFYSPQVGGGDSGALATTMLPEVSIIEALGIANFRYLFLFFHTLFPFNLAQIYPREFFLDSLGGGIYIGLLLSFALVALPFIFKKYKSLFLWGLLFFTFTLLPILLEEGPGTNFASDRYTYVPSIGVWFVIAALILDGLRKKVGRITAGVITLTCIVFAMAVGTFFQAQKWNDSVELFTQAIDNYPENWLALAYRAESLEDTEPEAALADYSRSIQIHPQHDRAIFGRGNLHLNSGDYQKAIADFTQTIAIDPNHLRAYVNRGNAYRSLGDNQRAIEDYNIVLQRRPDFIKALNNRGVAHLNLGHTQAALEDFNRVLELDPAYVNGYINRAALYINNAVRKYDQAIVDYNRALELDPENEQSLYFRGIALQQTGRYQEALQSVEQALTISPNIGRYWFTKAQLLRSLGRPGESAQAARQARALGYNVPAGWLE